MSRSSKAHRFHGWMKLRVLPTLDSICVKQYETHTSRNPSGCWSLHKHHLNIFTSFWFSFLVFSFFFFTISSFPVSIRTNLSIFRIVCNKKFILSGNHVFYLLLVVYRLKVVNTNAMITIHFFFLTHTIQLSIFEMKFINYYFYW